LEVEDVDIESIIDGPIKSVITAPAFDKIKFWDLAKERRFFFAVFCQIIVGGLFTYWSAILNPMLLAYYGMPPEKSSLIYLSSGPPYILCAPLAFKLLEKQLIRRRSIIILALLITGVM
jgi:hypothetical protein